MKAVWNLFLVLALMAGAGVAGYFIGHRTVSPATSEQADSDDEVAPTPTVQTAPILRGHVERNVTAYGVVAAQTGDIAVLSAAFESRIKKILVVPGQRLDADTPAIEIEPSPDTQLQMLQAKAAVESATKDLEQTRTRFGSQLATNQDLLQSEANMRLAQLKLDSMQSEGAGGAMKLKAGGLVAKVDVQEGQVVPAGTPLVEVAGSGKLQVRLGLEPNDAAGIHAGDRVALRQLGSDGPGVEGKVQMVAQRIDPDTRLMDVFVALPPDAAMPLDAYVRGELTIAGADGLVVPRSAVLPDDEGYSLFTVEQGKAVEHKVTISLQNDRSVQISGEGLSAGQMAVVLGNLELEDGMTVKTQAGEPPATQEAAQ
ncbi:MAG: efflux RND transporter periplasmic adaptor subunit [Tepidisphaeraceae bacterium]|jgi:RND family efflux transporter MFP subunit